jgi:hypothetical protein
MYLTILNLVKNFDSKNIKLLINDIFLSLTTKIAILIDKEYVIGIQLKTNMAYSKITNMY